MIAFTVKTYKVFFQACLVSLLFMVFFEKRLLYIFSILLFPSYAFEAEFWGVIYAMDIAIRAGFLTPL